MGPQTVNRIDLSLENRIYDVIALFIYLHCDVIGHLPMQTWFVYFSLSVQPLSTNFGLWWWWSYSS